MEKELPQFLRNIADQVENNTIKEDELRKLSEFYMSYLFSDKIPSTPEKDYMKFLILGWYIYNQIRNV